MPISTEGSAAAKVDHFSLLVEGLTPNDRAVGSGESAEDASSSTMYLQVASVHADGLVIVGAVKTSEPTSL